MEILHTMNGTTKYYSHPYPPDNSTSENRTHLHSFQVKQESSKTKLIRKVHIFLAGIKATAILMFSAQFPSYHLSLMFQAIIFRMRSGCSDLTPSIYFCPSSCVGKSAKGKFVFPNIRRSGSSSCFNGAHSNLSFLSD